jgi:hypothetical protein
MIYPGDGGTTGATGGDGATGVNDTQTSTAPECGPGFVLDDGKCIPVETIHVTGRAPIGGTLPVGGGTVPVGGSQPKPKPAPPTNYGQGPDQNKIPQPPFTCEAESVNIATCYSCSEAGAHGVICTCYDCERYTGKCTTGYDCTDDYGNR